MIEIDPAVFICAYDGNRMELRNGRYSAFYACPAYASERHCTNRLSMKDADEIIGECKIPEKIYQIRRFQVFYKLDQGIKLYYIRRREK